MRSVTVGIITFNGAHRMSNCLRSIQKWDDRPDGVKIDLLLLDDGSHGEHFENSIWCAKHYGVPIICHRENQGISKSWNDIVNYGNSDYIVLLNDDILVSRHWLTAGLYFLENNPNAGVVGWNFYYIVHADIEAILDSEDPIEIYRDPHDKRLLRQDEQSHSPYPSRVMVAVGSCFAFRREYYDLVGGFDERFRSFYEEIDFGTKLAKEGLPSFMLPYSILYHEWGKTFDENAAFLNPAKLMSDSRRTYKEKWNGDTDVTDPRFMDAIEPFEVCWLDSNLNEQRAIIE